MLFGKNIQETLE